MLVLNAGADINIKFSIKYTDRYVKLENITPLMWAIFDYNPELAKLLIEAGADINAKDKDGDTALYDARYRNDSKIEKILIENGAK